MDIGFLLRPRHGGKHGGEPKACGANRNGWQQWQATPVAVVVMDYGFSVNGAAPVCVPSVIRPAMIQGEAGSPGLKTV